MREAFSEVKLRVYKNSKCEQFGILHKRVLFYTDTSMIKAFHRDHNNEARVIDAIRQTDICPTVKQIVYTKNYACIEMERMEGTMEDLYEQGDSRKEDYLRALSKATSFWKLGFRHGDLHHQNFVYRTRNDGSRDWFLIDFEESTRTPHPVQPITFSLDDSPLDVFHNIFMHDQRRECVPKYRN